jgi:hypothetical protein
VTPNPSIEGMPKRLRLLCTPHVTRNDATRFHHPYFRSAHREAIEHRFDGCPWIASEKRVARRSEARPGSSRPIAKRSNVRCRAKQKLTIKTNWVGTNLWCVKNAPYGDYGFMVRRAHHERIFDASRVNYERLHPPPAFAGAGFVGHPWRKVAPAWRACGRGVSIARRGSFTTQTHNQ